jgi:hypothetical protein
MNDSRIKPLLGPLGVLAGTPEHHPVVQPEWPVVPELDAERLDAEA